MAEERQNISYSVSSKGSTITCKEDKDSDLSVITVIEKNHTRQVKKFEEIGNDGKNFIGNVKTEVILLDEAPAAKINDNAVKNCENRRVIELSDTISKMELRRQFKVDVASREGASSCSNDSRRNLEDNDDDDDGSAEILSRLPPGTILIKQSTSNTTTRACRTQDSDYVHDSSKESTETNSSGSSSANSYAITGKVKRMQHRGVRSKKIVEVRRNPVRNKKKKPIDEDFPRPRQRLLSVKRKVGLVVDPITRKRAKPAAVPYMNTRSVTRKMYTVGATYQAPTIHDAIEWKDWPAHGMHERPVWHPQFGLAYGYNDRYFLSLDDRTYREIIDDPAIEVVSVDPHPERVLLAGGKRKFENIQTENSSDYLEMCDNKISTSISHEKSFEACMHGSLHSVLAYCARVVTPTYKNTVDTKIRKITQSHDNPDSVKLTGATKMLPDVTKSLQAESKIGIQSLQTQATSSTKISGTSHPPSTSSSSSEVAKCLATPRRTISFTNVRNIQGNILQEVFGRASKNTLIFLKPTDPPVKTEKISSVVKPSSAKLITTTAKDSVEHVTEELNLARLDDNAISDEALMEISSMYNKLLPTDEIESIGKTTNEIKTPKTTVDATKSTEKSPSTESKKHHIPNGIRTICSGSRIQDYSGSKNIDIARVSRPSNANQATEIAKILAEYNQKAAMNSGTKSACFASANVLNARATFTNPGILEKDCGNNQGNRTTFLSVVEQPKRIKRDDDIGKKTYRVCNVFPKQESSANLSTSADNTIKTNISSNTEELRKNVDDNNRAMDLSTVKTREIQRQDESKPDESMNRQWLQELIEDTALLYCAAAGVRQDDVVNYLDTLDPTESIEWLGS